MIILYLLLLPGLGYFQMVLKKTINPILHTRVVREPCTDF